MSVTDQHADTRAAERSTVFGRDHRVSLLGGRATARYLRCGRWAITSIGVRVRRVDQELALSSYLDVLRAGRLRPLFTDVADRVPFARHGLDTYRYAEEAVLEPARLEPRWQPRWLALHSWWLLPAAAVVLRVGSAV